MVSTTNATASTMISHSGMRQSSQTAGQGADCRAPGRAHLVALRQRSLGLPSLYMPDELRIVASVANEFEADAVCGLLSDAGIRSMQQLSDTGVGGRVGGGGTRDVYVAERDAERARELLQQPQEPSSD